MTTYFVRNGGDGTAPTTWAGAFGSIQAGLNAAVGAGDIVALQWDAVPTVDAEMGAATQYIFASNSTQVLVSVSNLGGSAYAPRPMGTEAWVGNSTTGRAISFSGGNSKIHIFGVTFRAAGTATVNIAMYAGQGSHVIFDRCFVWWGTTASARVVIGIPNEGYSELQNTTIRFGSTGQHIDCNGMFTMIGGGIDPLGSVPPDLIKPLASVSVAVTFEGVDLSHCTQNILGANTSGCTDLTLIDCKMAAGVTLFEASSVPTRGAGSVTAYNSTDGGAPYTFTYANALGILEVSPTVYTLDGPTYDGVNNFSWKITTTANVTVYNPFVTPWISVYNEKLTPLTPSLEILRDGSITPYKDNEVWAGFMYQSTTGSLSTLVSDRMAAGGTPANQDPGALGAADWFNEQATAWFGKLNPTAPLTALSFGDIKARISVSIPSHSGLYVSPKIRDV